MSKYLYRTLVLLESFLLHFSSCSIWVNWYRCWNLFGIGHITLPLWGSYKISNFIWAWVMGPHTPINKRNHIDRVQKHLLTCFLRVKISSWYEILLAVLHLVTPWSEGVTCWSVVVYDHIIDIVLEMRYVTFHRSLVRDPFSTLRWFMFLGCT